MAGPLEKYKKLRLRDSLCVPYRYAMACKELGVILRLAFSKSPKSLQSLLVDDTLSAFRLLPQMQTQSAVEAAYALIQSAESTFPKQKRTLAATEFKQAKIVCKRRGKLKEDDIDPVNLPEDVLVHVFSFLDLHSLVTAGLVCWSWNAGANDCYLWQSQYAIHFGDSETVLGATAQADQHAPSDEVWSVSNQYWKDAFRRAYLGLPSWRNKLDRGYCFHCKAVVWPSNLKCPNQHQVRKSGNCWVKPLSPDQIGKYIVDEYDPWSTCSLDSDSETDEEYNFNLVLWTCIRH